MRANALIYSAMFGLLAGGASACSDAATAPEAPSSFSSDLTASTASASGPTGTATADTAQRLRCRADNELTEREIYRIRALYHAYLDAIAPYRALIDKVNQEAREAAQHGATREEIAKDSRSRRRGEGNDRRVDSPPSCGDPRHPVRRPPALFRRGGPEHGIE